MHHRESAATRQHFIGDQEVYFILVEKAFGFLNRTGLADSVPLRFKQPHNIMSEVNVVFSYEDVRQLV
jgi:hypothetical protein